MIKSTGVDWINSSFGDGLAAGQSSFSSAQDFFLQIIDDMMEALRLFGDKWKAETNEDKKKMYQTLVSYSCH